MRCDKIGSGRMKTKGVRKGMPCSLESVGTEEKTRGGSRLKVSKVKILSFSPGTTRDGWIGPETGGETNRSRFEPVKLRWFGRVGRGEPE